MKSLATWGVAAGFIAVVGCSSDDSAEDTGPSPYDALYTAAPSSATDTNRIDGLWETTVANGEASLLARVQFKDGKIVFASRCSGPGYETVTVGVTVNATWADSKITVSDAGGEDQKQSNGPAGKPPILCFAQLKGPGTSSYSLDDAKLTTLGYTFTKVTD